ncbi:hypothetical protein E2C01_024337 [Portunus trituberculatus]|uniref:Uncharacterized protein n=1 Tax=Portunus trituberculatus TaxID=210409 RepID=A0A5B7EA89_PORTR|nr:hypothetical protein [Portunus trituberculatus]
MTRLQGHYNSHRHHQQSLIMEIPNQSIGNDYFAESHESRRGVQSARRFAVAESSLVTDVRNGCKRKNLPRQSQILVSFRVKGSPVL